MGAGASTALASSVSESTVEELATALSSLSIDDRERLSRIMAGGDMPASANITLKITDLSGTSRGSITVPFDCSLEKLRECVGVACNAGSNDFRLLYVALDLGGNGSIVECGLCDGAQLSLILGDVWTRFEMMAGPPREKGSIEISVLDSPVPQALFPKGFKHPWHEEWLYDGGYMGFYLQATLGDCDYENPRDVMGSYNHSSHSSLLGMTKEDAAEKYATVVSKMLTDKALICTACAEGGVPTCGCEDEGDCDEGDCYEGDWDEGNYALPSDGVGEEE